MLEEVVGAALAVCRRTLAGHPVQVRVPGDLPLIQLDAVLMERLLANLFENAAKYTPAGAGLFITLLFVPVSLQFNKAMAAAKEKEARAKSIENNTEAV